ncbi:MAG: cyclic nucleotide-binding domain-containing protein [Candidatus Sericytochromatia bacterium]|nr:cyclic nucleotide-binding domain-containing protein [Candidatus Sericytochromatia bacterium]
MQTDRHLLQNQQVFQDFSPADIEILQGFLKPVNFAAQVVVLQQGHSERNMFFLLTGQAELCRHGLSLGLLESGQYFGELALIAGRPRSASVKALTPLHTLCLDLPAFEALQEQYPRLALRLQSALIARLGLQLNHMTDNYGKLLQERSLPRQQLIQVTLPTEQRRVTTGVLAGDVLPASYQDAPVVAALLNRKLVSLNTPLMSDLQLAPLTTLDWEGDRVYRHSVSLLMLEAAYRLQPDIKLQSMLSVGHLHWFSSNRPVSDLLPDLMAEITALCARRVIFRHEQWAIEEAMRYFEQNQRPEVLDLLAGTHNSTVSLASCGDYYVLSTGPLVPDSGYIQPPVLHARPDGLVLQTSAAAPPVEQLEAYAQVMAEHVRWQHSLGIQSVGAFNQACLDSRIDQLIRVAEGFHEKRLGQIADAITASQGQLRVICIAGPSSSGKSTFIQRLSTQLMVNGLEPLTLSLDDYYRNRDETPRDADGELDFECLEALNLPLLHQHLRALLAGDAVATARFDFIQGRSQPEGGGVLQLKPQSILLLEGIHGLNPALLDAQVPEERLFRIFIQPMVSLALDSNMRINPSDLRLLRRIVRDRHQRATAAADSILRWKSVRQGEQKYIFPFVKEAHVIFDSALIYELGVLKIYAERYLLEVPRAHPAFATASRLLQLLRLFVSLYPNAVPPTSILREFVHVSGV